MANMYLPAWASQRDNGVVEVDFGMAMPAMLEELGVRLTPLGKNEVAELDKRYVDQYWLAVAKEFIKLDVQMAVQFGKTRPANGTLAIHISCAPEWKFDKFPVGKGEEAAVKGKEAKELYKQLRGMLPV